MMLFGTKTLSFMLLTSMSTTMVVEGANKQGNLRRSLADRTTPIATVNLLTAGKFAILTKAGVSTTSAVTPTSVTGDVGSSPVAATFNTGFGLIADSTNTFATSSFVTGEIYASSDGVPTPNMLTVAVLDMQAAFVDAAGRPDPDFTEHGAGAINGFNLTQGLYKWGTDVFITDSLNFHGPETAVWILQIAGDVTIGTGAKITLSGGAKAENIFWQVGGKTIFGTTSHIEGVFLCKTSIVFQTGSSLNGAALSQTAVTLDTATIVKESVCDATVGCQE